LREVEAHQETEVVEVEQVVIDFVLLFLFQELLLIQL
jgi:hypothetical protein